MVLLLVFQTGASWNMHHAFGATSEQLKTTVTLRLAEDGTVTATDVGQRREHNLYQDGRTHEEVTTWSTAWAGTWSSAEGAMRIVLKRSEDTCTGSCASISEKLVLQCAPEEVLAGVSGWRCEAARGSAHTAAPWLVAEGQCVEQSRGKFTRYEVSACE